MDLEQPINSGSPEVAVAPWPGMKDRPTDYANIAGAAYATKVHADHRKNHGLYLPAVAVADFMATQVAVTGNEIRPLDPAARVGILLCAVVESLATRCEAPCHLVAYEINPHLLSES
jgi:adenine-specific DNA-methyltransferase